MSEFLLFWSIIKAHGTFVNFKCFAMLKCSHAWLPVTLKPHYNKIEFYMKITLS